MLLKHCAFTLLYNLYVEALVFHSFTSLTFCYRKEAGRHYDSQNINLQSLAQWGLATTRAYRQPKSSLGKYQLLFKGRPVLLTSVWHETSQTCESL